MEVLLEDKITSMSKGTLERCQLETGHRNTMAYSGHPETMDKNSSSLGCENGKRFNSSGSLGKSAKDQRKPHPDRWELSVP